MITLLLFSGATAMAEAEVSASVHGRAVRGQSIRVMIEVRNPTSEPLSFPDLTNRPWLVRFETVDPEGTRRTLFSTHPDVDTRQRWTLAPNGRRRAHFDIPTSSTWSLGSASLRVSVEDTSLDRLRVEVVDLNPHHVDEGGKPVDQAAGTGASLPVPVNSSTELYFRVGTTTSPPWLEKSGGPSPRIEQGSADGSRGQTTLGKCGPCDSGRVFPFDSLGLRSDVWSSRHQCLGTTDTPALCPVSSWRL